LQGHRIIRAAALTALMLCLQAASASASSTLLSGYGGPGQGNQAIIGATLIGGGSGGGSGSGSTGAQATGSTPASIALPQTSAGKGGGRSGRRRTHPARPAGKPSASSKTTATGGARRPAPAAARPGGGGTLGLTGADVLYIILAFCVLAATAVLTSRLTGRTGRAGGTR